MRNKLRFWFAILICFTALSGRLFSEPDICRAEDVLCHLAPLMQTDHSDGELETLVDTAAFSELGSGNGVVVAVIDTGIDLKNPLFEAAVFLNPDEIPGDGIDNDFNGFVDDFAGWDMAENKQDIQDIHGHGTKVAWLVMSLAPNVSILPIKVTTGLEDAFSSDIAAQAIIYAVKSGANIINLSFTSQSESIDIKYAIDFAVASGVLVVGAAGNTGMDVEFPATMDQVIAVGSSSISNMPSWFSPSGKLLDILAPGEDLPVVGLDTAKEYVSGTSFSTPLVSGSAAVLLSMNPHLKPDSIKNMLYNGTLDILSPGFDDMSGYGVINGKALYAEAVPSIYPMSQIETPFPLTLGLHLPPMDTQANIFLAFQYQGQIWWLSYQNALEIKSTTETIPSLAQMNQESMSTDFILFGDKGVFPSIETDNVQGGKYLWGIFISDMNGISLGPVGLTEMILLE